MRTKSVLCLALGALCFMPGMSRAQNDSNRGAATLNVPARVNEERVNVRQGPHMDAKRIRLVDKETRVTTLVKKGDWVQIRLEDGQTGWIGQQFLLYEQMPPLQTVPPAIQGNKTGPPVTKSQTPTLKPTTRSGQPNSRSPKSSTAAKPDEPTGALAGTKPNPTARTQDSPAATMGDGWRMLLYLLPVLAVIVLGVRGLKSLQQRPGKIPTLKQAFWGGFNLSNARKTGGSSIRVVESVPIGTVSLHLVEVRGRLLLLGATGSNVSVLTEFKDADEARQADFQSLLTTVAVELEDNIEEAEGSIGLVVGSLDDSIREAREAIARSAARTRLTYEGETSDEISKRKRRL